MSEGKNGSTFTHPSSLHGEVIVDDGVETEDAQMLRRGEVRRFKDGDRVKSIYAIEPDIGTVTYSDGQYCIVYDGDETEYLILDDNYLLRVQ